MTTKLIFFTTIENNGAKMENVDIKNLLEIITRIGAIMIINNN